MPGQGTEWPASGVAVSGQRGWRPFLTVKVTVSKVTRLLDASLILVGGNGPRNVAVAAGIGGRVCHGRAVLGVAVLPVGVNSGAPWWQR